MDPVWLSRVQFGMTAGFHYIFPPLTIGMSVVLVYLEARYLKTRDPLFELAARFWTRIFALNFAIGVATGIVLEFQFGTNWATYSRFVGDVFGSALAAEGIFAFFLESGFLAVLVFGWDRVSAGMHFFATLMVSLGGIFSSIWIVVANSWQQTPTGHHIVQVLRDGQPLVVDGVPAMRAEIVDFWAMVFNPSTVQRLVHVWLGAFILGAFFIMSISAYYLLRQRHVAFAQRSFTGALLLATVSSLAMLASGHQQAGAVYAHQPAKLAAFEGHYRSGPAALSLMALPDPENEALRFNLAVPGGLSFLVEGDFSAPLIGLDRFRPEDRPPVTVPFLSYHLMVGLGFFFIGITLLACFLLWRGRLYQSRWLLWVFVFSVIGPILGNETGWIAAEVGRQPWVVYPPLLTGDDGTPRLDAQERFIYDKGRGLRTADAGSHAVSAGQVLGSILGFGAIYLALLAAWLFILDRKIRHGPEPALPGAATGGVLAAAAIRPGHGDSLTEPAPIDGSPS